MPASVEIRLFGPSITNRFSTTFLVQLTDESLELPAQHVFADGATEGTVSVTVREKPQDNTHYEGLYKSGGKFVTQMEADGMRRFCYSIDRPDVMSTFRVYLEAAKDKYPSLLSNGNLADHGSVEGNDQRHWAVWEDPFPKVSKLAIATEDIVWL